jgi:hypothetical protein
VDGHRSRFEDDLAASVAFGDARWADARQMLSERLPARGYAVPELPIPSPFRYVPVKELDLRDFGAFIFTSGYRPDFRWIDFAISDQHGYPVTIDGASPLVPGLYFCGVQFMRTRRSGFLFGVGADAALVAEQIAHNERRSSPITAAAHHRRDTLEHKLLARPSRESRAQQAGPRASRATDLDLAMSRHDGGSDRLEMPAHRAQQGSRARLAPRRRRDRRQTPGLCRSHNPRRSLRPDSRLLLRQDLRQLEAAATLLMVRTEAVAQTLRCLAVAAPGRWAVDGV